MEQYHYANSDIIAKMFFRHIKFNQNLARKRMSEVEKAGYIVKIDNVETNSLIYMWKDKNVKPPSRHRMIILEIMAELNYLGYTVDAYEIEKEWSNGQIRSDAFLIFTVNGRRYYYFVEVHLSNNPPNLSKYDTLYKTLEVQNFIGKDVYPRILFVCDKQFTHTINYSKIFQVNANLDKLSTILF